MPTNLAGNGKVEEEDRAESRRELSDGRRHVVILVHGIRDFALWEVQLRSVLEEAGFIVEATNYGRMNLLQFLTPLAHFRKLAISTVWRQIRIIKQSNEDKSLSVIAHSFGTFVIAHLLKDEFDIKFDKVVFCGSVVPYDFPFEEIRNRFSAPILNEVGTRDPWPALAESITVGYGSAGTYGFRRPLVRDRWHNSAHHGFFLSAEFCRKFWIPFLNNGTFVQGADEPEPPRIWLRLLSVLKIKWFLALILCFYLATAPWMKQGLGLVSHHIDVPDPRTIGTDADLAAALRKLEVRKGSMTRDQIYETSTALTGKLLPSSDSSVPRGTRRDMNEKIVATLLSLNDRDLSFVWKSLPTNLDLSFLDLKGVKLGGVHFNKTFLIYTDFAEAYLSEAVFNDAYVRNANFKGARMSNTTFPETDWFNARNIVDPREVPTRYSEWLPCPGDYRTVDRSPFVVLFADWYDVTFTKLSHEDSEDLSRNWALYTQANGLCDVVQQLHDENPSRQEGSAAIDRASSLTPRSAQKLEKAEPLNNASTPDMNEELIRDMTIQIDLCAFDRGNEQVVECVTHGACRGPGSLGLPFPIDKTSKESAIYTCKQWCVSEAKSRNAICKTPPPF